MPAALTTTTVAEVPHLVFIGDNELQRALIASFSREEVTHSVFALSDALSLGIDQDLQSAYKIVFYVDWKAKSYQLKELAHLLAFYNQAVLLIEVNSTKKNPVQDLVSLFPNAQFLFIRDLVSSSSSPLRQFSKLIPTGIVPQVECKIAPLSLSDLVTPLRSVLFRSSKAGVIFVGTEIAAAEAASLIAATYNQYHQTNLVLQLHSFSPLELLPMSVSEQKIHSNPTEIITAFVRSLPSLSNWPVATLPAPVEEKVAISKPKKMPARETEKLVLEPLRPAPKESVFSEITSLFANSHQQEKQQKTSVVTKVSAVISKKKRKNTALFFAGLISTGIALGVLCLVGVFVVSVRLTERAARSLVLHVVESEELAQEESSVGWFDFLTLQANSYGSFIDIPMITNAEHTLSIIQSLLNYSQVMPRARESQRMLFQHVVGQVDSDVGVLAQNVTTQAQRAYELLSTLDSELTTASFMNEDDESIVSKLQARLVSERTALVLQQQLLPLLPEMTGVSSKQTYALLFQNSQELRPTGGFIQAVVFVTFAQGTIIDYSVMSSYELDAALSGAVAPPLDITRLLGEEQWYVHDSNWDPDFPTTAKTISWFVDQTRNTQLAGVVAIDTQALANIIEVVGPVDLPEYNEVVTHKNLSERLEFHSEAVLVPDSGTTDYSRVLLERSMSKIIGISLDKYPDFLTALRQAADHQHLFLSVFSEEIQPSIQNVGWTGAMLQPACPTQLVSESCTVEPFFQVEANVGVNKANYYIERDLSHAIEITTNSAEHLHRTTYLNTAQSGSWPKGPYKAYVRYYLDKNSQYKAAKIDGRPISIQNLTLSTEHNRTVAGISIEVPVGQTVTTELVYSTPLVTAQTYSYAFFNQKQAGTGDDPITVTMTYPQGDQPEKIAPQAETGDFTLTFMGKLDKHGFYGAQFSR
ncbi:MAG: hypothetical protein COY80_03505 [Candidatus Pacebacteria bacterium CG_4_10_14_0_8_um_filter_42_14]|nr:MAG: hypothetical protein COY80_03505 [Candidatus Pacebacteria bacterium CG_4_10_14_0_8_um_filter_42_14]